MRWAIVFGLVLTGVQVFEGTSFSFALLHLSFIVVWAFAFNLASGFKTTTGAYVFWWGLLTILVGTTLRAAIGQPGDSGLDVPLMTMMVYAASAVGLLGAVVVSQWMVTGTERLPDLLGANRLDYHNAAIGCLIAGTAIQYAFLILPQAFWGPVLVTLTHVNALVPLAILLGTVDAVESSGGRRAVSWVNGLAMLSMFYSGLVGFSKEGMLTPVASLVVGMAYTRYRLGWKDVAAIAIFSVIFQVYLYPISQVGRFMFDDVSQTARLEGAWDMAQHIGIYRERLALESVEEADDGLEPYFNKNLGFAYRLQRWQSDDPLIAFTMQGHTVGYAYTGWMFINLFPHLVLPEKDKYYVEGGGNYYARQMGWIPETNTGTGISYGSGAEAFHIDKWAGVCLLQPAIWILFFVVNDFVCGDLRHGPWGMAYVVLFAHAAPEAGITSLIDLMWWHSIGLIIGMAFAINIAPIVGSAFGQGAPRRRALSFQPSFQPAAGES
jgi:hypothetical protein